MSIKKVYFHNYYTPYIFPHEEEELLEFLTVFYEYNSGLIKGKEELSLIQSLIDAMKFIRSIPSEFIDIEDFDDMDDEELFQEVYTIAKETIESAAEVVSEDKEDFIEGLSVRVALALGMTFDGEVIVSENLITTTKEGEEVFFSNFELGEETEETEED